MAHILLDDVSLSFPIYGLSSQSLKKALIGSVVGGRVSRETSDVPVVDALRNVSIVLEDGDRLGLIGHNGAGKTTLLRVISGIYAPASGKIEISGQVTPLIDVRLGLEMDGTGYENILLRGFYLGRTRNEIEDATDEIAEFCELGPYLDLPIRTYSAGMLSRLLFATSTAFKPEILVLDEGIGAGDAAFMQKIKQRTGRFVEQASIVVIASHSNGLLREHCNVAAIMEHGTVKSFGPVEEQIRLYEHR